MESAVRQDRRVEVLDVTDAWLRRQTLEVIDGAMASGNLSMADVFPLLVGIGADSRRFIVRDEAGVAAHAASRTVKARIATGGEVVLANIGCVATDERARRRGHGSLLVRALLASARARGADLAVLWTSEPAFYRPLGFHEGGVDTCFRVSRSELRDVEPECIRPVVADDIPVLSDLRRTDALSIARTPDEFRKLLQIPRSHAFALLEGEAVVGYFVVGKGLDYPGMVAEWAMPPSRLPGALRALLQESGASETLIFGPPRGAWRLTMERQGFAREDHTLGMFRVLDRQRLCRRALLEDAPGLDDRTFLRKLVGHPAESEEPAIPFYIWGLDSN